MGESASFSSLMDLVESHLSKTSLQSNDSGPSNTFTIPKLGSFHDASPTDVELPPPIQKFIIPVLNSNKSPLTNILAERTVSTLKAKELRLQKEKEQQELDEKFKKVNLQVEDDEYVIDLTEALASPTVKPLKRQDTEELDQSYEINFIDCDLQPVASPTLIEKPNLLCHRDIPLILKFKNRKRKCSDLARVLCARYKQLRPQYVYELYSGNTKRFDFSSLSPDDMLKEEIKKRKVQAHDLFSALSLQKSELLQRTANS